MKKIKKIALIAALLFLMGFGVSGKELKLEKRTAEDDIFKPVQMLTSGGKVFILDKGDKKIKVFSPDGILETTLGRRGEGPGEFALPMDLYILGDNIFVLDKNLLRIQVYSAKNLKYSKTQAYSFQGVQCSDSGPTGFTMLPDGTTYFWAMTLFKNEKVIIKLNKSFAPENQFLEALPAYRSMDEFGKSNEPRAKDFLNCGYLAASENNVYFAYYLLNSVLEFNKEGQKIKEYKLPLNSIDKTVKVITNPNGSYYLEKQLVYDLKFYEKSLFVLTRGNSGESVIFEKVKDSFKEVFRMREPLSKFAFQGSKLFAIDEDTSELLIYKIN